jgi:hypothetical protein
VVVKEPPSFYGEMIMRKKSAIEDFARDTLGCNCPDEVFDVIECKRGNSTTDNYGLRLSIGGRLLVYVVETNDIQRLRDTLPAMLTAGKTDRDKNGMNRFRAVLATDEVTAMDEAARGIFDDHGEVDDKVHLHVVKKSGVSAIYLECP